MNGWWERDDLRYAADRLIFAGRAVARPRLHPLGAR